MTRHHFSVLGLGLFATVVGLGSTSCKQRTFNTKTSATNVSPGNEFSAVGLAMEELKNNAVPLDLINTTTDRREWEGCFLSQVGSATDPWRVMEERERATKGTNRAWENREGGYLPPGVVSVTSTEYRVEAHYQRFVENMAKTNTMVNAKLRNRVRNYVNTVIEDERELDGSVVGNMSSWDKDNYRGFADLFNLARKVPEEWVAELNQPEKNDDPSAKAYRATGRTGSTTPNLDRVKFFEWKESFDLGRSDSDAVKLWSEHGKLTGVYKHRLAALKEDVDLVLANRPHLREALATFQAMKSNGKGPLVQLLEQKLLMSADEIVANYKKLSAEGALPLAQDATYSFIRVAEGKNLLRSVNSLKNDLIQNRFDAQQFVNRTVYMNFILSAFFGYRVKQANTFFDRPYSIPTFLIEKAGMKKADIASGGFELDRAQAEGLRTSILQMAAATDDWIENFLKATLKIYDTLDLDYNQPLFTQNYVRKSWKMKYRLPSPEKLIENESYRVSADQGDAQALDPIMESGQGEVTVDRFVKMVPVHLGYKLEEEFLQRFNTRYSPDQLVCMMTKLPPAFASAYFQKHGQATTSDIQKTLLKSPLYAPLAEVYSVREKFFGFVNNDLVKSFVFSSKPRLYPLTFKDRDLILKEIGNLFNERIMESPQRAATGLKLISQDRNQNKSVRAIVGGMAQGMQWAAQGRLNDLQAVGLSNRNEADMISKGQVVEPQLAALANVVIQTAYYATQAGEEHLAASTRRYQPGFIKEALASAVSAKLGINFEAASQSQPEQANSLLKGLQNRAQLMAANVALNAASSAISTASDKQIALHPETFLNSPLFYFVNTTKKDPTPVTGTEVNGLINSLLQGNLPE